MDSASTWTQNTGDWLQKDWATLGAMDPLNPGGSSSAWAAQASGPFTFDQRQSASRGIDYEPFYAGRSMYEPYSGFTNKIIDANIQQYLEREYPELFSFDTGYVNTGTGSSGTVARDPSFGRFANTPEIYDLVQQSANKYGVPANVMMVVLAKESSGDWYGDGRAGKRNFVGGQWNDYMYPFTGIYKKTAESRISGVDFFGAEGNMAAQVDMLGGVLRSMIDQLQGEVPNFGYENLFAYYFSGNPNPGNAFSDRYVGGDMDTPTYVRDAMAWLNQLNAWSQANGGQVGGLASGAGIASPTSPAWQPVNQWDGIVSEASTQYGVPANLIKAVIRLESGGIPTAQHGSSGATGLMQVMPGMHGLSAQQLLDPRTNVLKGAEILRNNFNRWGSWEKAVKAYLAGTPDSMAVDANGTGVQTYWNTVQNYWGELDAGVSGAFGEGSTEAISNINMIWGGIPTTITQEHGPSQFANDHPEWYEYSIPLLGALGHPGIDVGMPEGTKLFSPVTGTVRVAGPEQGYRIGPLMDVWTPGTGGLMIEMDNGHRVWLGHMAGIHVNVGDRVNAGTYVGLSGSAGTGEHLHLEYQIPSNRWGGPFEAVDPREALMGVYGGTFSGQMTGAGIDRPMTFQDLMRAGAMGEPIKGGMTIASGNSWNSWLQQAMAGKIPSSTSTGSWASRAADAEGMDTSGDSWRGYTPRTNMWSSWGYS